MNLTDFHVGQRVETEVPNGRTYRGSVGKIGRKYLHVDLDIPNGGRWPRLPAQVRILAPEHSQPLRLRINGKPVDAQAFVYDGCHKIYLLGDDHDRRKMIARGWKDSDIHPVWRLPAIWEQTCPLRFISGVGPEYESYVDQAEDAAVTYG